MTFVTYVAPDYPSRAVRRNVEGWVDVEFTVGENGSVIEVKVKDTERKGYFEKATIDAVSQWEFLPREFRGRNIDQRVATRVQFNRD